MNDYIRHSQGHAAALRDHESTTTKLREDAQQQSNRAYVNRLETWDKAFRATADNYKDACTLTKEEMQAAKDLGYDVDDELKKSELLASKTIVGQTGMNEAVDLIHKGRVYPALKAKNMILEKQLAERDALIKKLRGGGTGGGESHGGAEKKPAEKQSREEWQKQFSANRAGVQA